MNKSQQSLIRQIFENAPENSINMALGEPVFKRPDWFTGLINSHTINRFAYSPNAGYPESREAVVTMNGYPQHSIEHICLTCGAEEGLFAALSGIKLLRGEGKGMLAPDPYFLTYPMIAKLLGFHFDTYELPDWSGKSYYDSIIENIKKDTAVIILNSPGNPGGNMISEEEIKKIENLCIEKDIFLLVDEVYRYFGNIDLPVSHDWQSVEKNTLLVSSVTKNFGLPGLRLGWVYTENGVMNTIIAAHQSITAISPGISQQIVSKFPEHDYLGWLRKNREKTIKNRLGLMDLLDQYDLEYIKPEGAFYLMLKIPETVLKRVDDIETAFILRDQFSILLVPGSAFGKNVNGYMRLSFGGQGDDFPEAVRRISDGFKHIIS